MSNRAHELTLSTSTIAEELPDGRMTARAAAAYLGLAPGTLENKRSNGTGPPFVKRGRVFYYRTDLDEWLRAGRATSTADAKRKAGGRR